MKTEMTCLCGYTGTNVRLIRIRIEGKATLFKGTPVPACKVCRKAIKGKWKYAE